MPIGATVLKSWSAEHSCTLFLVGRASALTNRTVREATRNPRDMMIDPVCKRHVPEFDRLPLAT